MRTNHTYPHKHFINLIILVIISSLCLNSSTDAIVANKTLQDEYYSDFTVPSCLSSTDVEEFGWTSSPPYLYQFKIHVNQWDSSYLTNIVFYYVAREVMNRVNTTMKVLKKRQVTDVSGLGHVFSNIDQGLVDLTLESWLWDNIYGLTKQYNLIKRTVSGAPSNWIGRTGFYLSATIEGKVGTSSNVLQRIL